jgi:hypothetical protein
MKYKRSRDIRASSRKKDALPLKRDPLAYNLPADIKAYQDSTLRIYSPDTAEWQTEVLPV